MIYAYKTQDIASCKTLWVEVRELLVRNCLAKEVIGFDYVYTTRSLKVLKYFVDATAWLNEPSMKVASHFIVVH